MAHKYIINIWYKFTVLLTLLKTKFSFMVDDDDIIIIIGYLWCSIS